MTRAGMPCPGSSWLMRIRRVLSEQLVAGPFTPAQAALHGMTGVQLRHPALTRTTHGGRSTTPVLDVCAQAAGVLVALPEDVAVSHTTAARLWGLPTPRTWSVDDAVDVMRDHGRARLRRRGIVFHRGLGSREVECRSGLRVVSRGDTWCDLAGELALADLVALGDAVIGRGSPVRMDQLTELVDRRGGFPGVASAREALPLLRGRSRSPMESKARLVFVRGGLPEPELNVDVHNARGEWLANVDFAWRAQRLIAEYDGDQHRTDRRRWRQTVARREQLHDEHWRVVTMTEPDITVRPHETVARLRAALAG